MRNVLLFLLTLLFTSTVAVAQQGTGYRVKGQIVDPDGVPVVGATVVADDENSTAVATDIEGRFVLSTPSPQTKLTVYYAGYKALSFMANSEVLKNPVAMEEDTQSLEAIAVVGYGTLRKSDMTGSVDVIGADLGETGMVNSASEMIMGKVPGLQVTLGSGQPGSSSQLRIRGGSSLSASNDPLIVIDGVPVQSNAGAGMTNPLGAINPNDIASFTILKDASSAAIYGSRGANGVIIITTKKGTGSKFTLNYNSDYSVSVNSNSIKTMTGSEYRNFINEYYADDATVQGLMNQYPEVSTNWQDMIYRAAFGTNQYVSGSGTVRNDFMNMGYRASLGYTGQEGTVKTSNYNRYTLDVGLAPKFFNDHLAVDINFKGVLSDQNNVAGDIISTAAFYDPTKPVYWLDGSDKFNGYFAHLDSPTDDRPNTNSAVNPMALLNEQYNRDKSQRMIGNIQMDYKMPFLPELRANLNLGYDASKGENTYGVAVNSEQAWRDGNFQGVGSHTDWTGIRKNSLLDFYLNYANDFKKNRLDVMAGYSWQHFYTDDIINTFGNDAEQGSTPFFKSYDANENYLVSFFGRANYSYDSRYLLTATVRYDGSSRFSKNNRWGLFPSAAIGWNISQEQWMKNTRVNNLKLRASWGITGQQDLGLNDYPYQANYTTSNEYSQYQFGNQWYHLLKPDAYDENIKWEETTSWNVGMEFGAYNNRITATIDLYKKYTHDLLNSATVPAGTNFSNTVVTNIGDLENEGIEMSIGVDIIRSGNWTWNVGGNMTLQDTRITRLTARDDPEYLGILFGDISIGTGTSVMLHAVGHRPSSYYVYEQVYDINGQPLQNVFVDRNGDGVISDADRYVAGSIQPDIYYGFSTTLEYKQWDFSINAHGVYGNKIFNDFRMANSTTQNAHGAFPFLSNMTYFYQETGFTQVNTVAQSLSDYWLEDGSYLRVDNITLGYSFQDLFKTEGLNGRLSFTVQNPFLFTNYSGLDPETSWGVDGVIWPRPTVYMLGLSLRF